MRHHTRALAAALALSAVSLSACSTTPAPQTPAPSSPAPAPATTVSSAPSPEVPGNGTFPRIGDADRTDVDSTARTTAVLLHSWDTATDGTETAAAIRAKPLMSAEWASYQVEPQRNSAQGEWLVPAQHRAYSRAHAVPAVGDVSTDVAPDKAVRAYEVSWRWASRDGQPVTETGARQVTIYLQKRFGAWEVVGHRFGAAGTPDTEAGS